MYHYLTHDYSDLKESIQIVWGMELRPYGEKGLELIAVPAGTEKPNDDYAGFVHNLPEFAKRHHAFFGHLAPQSYKNNHGPIAMKLSKDGV